jgi:hypothetical protein
MSPTRSSGDISSSNNYIKIMIAKIFFLSFVHDIKVFFKGVLGRETSQKDFHPDVYLDFHPDVYPYF